VTATIAITATTVPTTGPHTSPARPRTAMPVPATATPTSGNAAEARRSSPSPSPTSGTGMRVENCTAMPSNRSLCRIPTSSPATATLLNLGV
jgi:hypothetical protein